MSRLGGAAMGQRGARFSEFAYPNRDACTNFVGVMLGICLEGLRDLRGLGSSSSTKKVSESSVDHCPGSLCGWLLSSGVVRCRA